MIRIALCVALAALVPAGALAATAPGPKRAHTKADTALAQRALLRQSDLSKGWTSVPAQSKPSALTCASFQPKQSDLVETGAAAVGFRGSAAGPFVAQSAWVYKTDAQAQAFWKRVVGKGLLRCLVQSITGGSTKDVTLTVQKSGELAVPKLAPRTTAFRVVGTAKTAGQSTKTYYDMFVLASGRTVTQVSFAQFGAAIPSAAELVLARAAATRLGVPGAA
jgi:hypothetical protein